MNKITRRQLLHFAGAAAVAIPVTNIVTQSQAFAEGSPQVALDDPTAIALGYVHDTTTVDKAVNAQHSNAQTCANCALIQSGEGEWRPCAIFPGKTVNANGWCKSWSPKA